MWNAAAERKLASIGIAVKRWVTLHGFALNVATDLRRFAAINPCGFDAAVMGSMSGELGRTVDMPAVKQAVRETFADVFERRFSSYRARRRSPARGPSSEQPDVAAQSSASLRAGPSRSGAEVKRGAAGTGTSPAGARRPL